MNDIYTLEIRSEAPTEDIRSALRNFAAGYNGGNTVNSEGKIILWSDNGWNCGSATPAAPAPAPAPKPSKPVKPAGKRISAKHVGETLLLAFHGRYDRNFGENLLVKIEGAGDDARATFMDAAGMQWQAYRYNGRWAYGSGAHRLTVVND